MQLFVWIALLAASLVDHAEPNASSSVPANDTEGVAVIPPTEFPAVLATKRASPSNEGSIHSERYNGRGEYHVGYDILLSCGIDYPGDNLYGADHQQIVLSKLGRANCYILCDWFILNWEAATWTSYNGGTCFFKWGITPILSWFHEGAATSFSTPKDASISDDKFAVYPYGNCDMPGYDVANERRVDPSGCVKACNKVKECWAWTWTDHNGGTCWLKSQARVCAVKKGAQSGYHWKRVENAGHCMGLPPTGIYSP